MTLAKLTDKQKEECCRLLASGQLEIPWASRRYGVSTQTVRDWYSDWNAGQKIKKK